MTEATPARRPRGAGALHQALQVLIVSLAFAQPTAHADAGSQPKPGYKALYGRWIEILAANGDRHCGALHMNFSRDGDFASGDGSIVQMRSWQALPRNGGLLIQLMRVHDFGTAMCEGSAADRISKLGRTSLFAELGDGGARMKLYFSDKPGPEYVELLREKGQ